MVFEIKRRKRARNISGKDIVGSAPKRGRSLAYGIGLALAWEKGDKNRVVVITDSEGDAERVANGLADFNVPAVAGLLEEWFGMMGHCTTSPDKNL